MVWVMEAHPAWPQSHYEKNRAGLPGIWRGAAGFSGTQPEPSKRTRNRALHAISDQASCVTCAILNVDGGIMAGRN
jgi:hypothetical protein